MKTKIVKLSGYIILAALILGSGVLLYNLFTTVELPESKAVDNKNQPYETYDEGKG